MPVIVDRPLIYTLNPCYKPNYYCHGLSYFCSSSFSRVSLSNFIRHSSSPHTMYRQVRVSIHRDFYNSSLIRKSNSGIRANSSCEHDSNSTSSSSSSSDKSDTKQVNKEPSNSTPSSQSSSSSSRREKEGKSWFRGTGGKWRWQPLIQAQEIGVLLLQLGIVMFVVRLLRPGIQLPGSEPRPPTTFVSVPYSEFLNILFKLKNEGSNTFQVEE